MLQKESALLNLSRNTSPTATTHPHNPEATTSNALAPEDAPALPLAVLQNALIRVNEATQRMPHRKEPIQKRNAVVEAQRISESRHGRGSAGETAGVLSRGRLLEKQLRNEMVQSWKEVEERFAEPSTLVLAAWAQHWGMY
jgi:hypothetical protein